MLCMVKCEDGNYDFLEGGICLKRTVSLFFACLLIMSLICVPVSAESGASKIEAFFTVNSEGDCMVSMTVNLRLESADDGLTFPLPLQAENITMNGGSVKTTKNLSAIDVDISKITGGLTGEHRITFDYILPEAVRVGKVETAKNIFTRRLQLEIPMLCGFSFPVESFSYVVTMPMGDMPDLPRFSSIYRQEGIESDMARTIKGNQIIGATNTVLNDHEGWTMALFVAGGMFPTVSTYIREGIPELMPMLIIAGVAVLYWLLFMSTWPLIRKRNITPPEGMTAGEMGCHLTLAGSDLTMMVFHWAQRGYLLIQLDGNGRVLLYKRMDMGNERSQYENKVYRMLFGSRRVVEATGQLYADLAIKISGTIPGERTLVKSRFGSMKLFRLILCVAMVFCGICVAMNMTQIFALQIVLSVLFGAFGLVSAWLIQGVAYRTHLRGKVPVYMGLVCVVIWILLGLLCGQVWIPLGAALGQWALGYLAAYGGRRTDVGRYDAGRILGLRHYLKHIPRDSIGRLMSNDPDYFFNLAPFALALGVINPFAKAFARRKLNQCPYLVSGTHGKRSAEEWAKLLSSTADMMDQRSRRMMVEKWLTVPSPSAAPKKSKRRPASRKPAPKQQPRKRKRPENR